MNPRRDAEKLGRQLGAGVIQYTIELEAQITRTELQPLPTRLEPRKATLDPAQTFAQAIDRSEPLGPPPDLVFRRLIIRAAETTDWDIARVLVAAQAGCAGPLVFELWLESGRASLYIAAPASEIDLLAGSWQQYADCACAPSRDPFPALAGRVRLLRDLLSPAGYECAISAPQAPLAGLFQAGAALPPGEILKLEVVYQRTIHPWQQNIAAIHAAKHSLGHRSPCGPTLASKPLDQPFFAANIRVLSTTTAIAPHVDVFIRSFSAEGQPFDARSLTDYTRVLSDAALARLLALRLVHAPGQLLIPPELALVVHVPGSSSTGAFALETRSGIPVPARLSEHGLLLGQNITDGVTTAVQYPVEDQYNTNVSIVGVSGFGKSAALVHWILGLARLGYSVIVIDPHGSLATTLIGAGRDIDEERFVYLDFDDPLGLTVAFNGFADVPPKDQARLALEFAQTASSLVGTHGYPRLTHFLINGAAGLCALGENLTTLPALFSRTPRGNALRRTVADTSTDESVQQFFGEECALHRPEEFTPLITRFSALCLDRRARQTFSQRENRVDLPSLMDAGKIVVIKTPSSIEAAKLVGGLFIGHTKHAAFRRGTAPPPYRKCFLVVEELSRFLTSEASLAEILDQTNKFGLRLWTVHQQSNQLTNELLKTIAGIDTLCFRQNFVDAKYYAQLFNGHVEAGVLTSLRTGEVYARLGHDLVNFSCPPPIVPDAALAARIIEASRAKYYVAPQTPAERPRTRAPRVLDTF